jgi:hypothetical protein
MDKFLIHRKIIQFKGMNNPLQTATLIFFYIRHQLVVKSKSDYGTAILSYGQPKKEGRIRKKLQSIQEYTSFIIVPSITPTINHFSNKVISSIFVVEFQLLY